jgi:hypothetical protein
MPEIRQICSGRREKLSNNSGKIKNQPKKLVYRSKIQ